MNYRIATKNEDAIRACEPFSLDEPGDPRYVDLSERYGICRGGSNRLVKAMQTEGEPSRHMVLAGSGGSGKSTLVLQSFAEFRKSGIYPVHINIIDMLDPGDIQYSDLLLTMVAGVGKSVESDGLLHDVAIDQSAVDDVADWFKTRVLSEEHIKELSLNVEAGAKASTGIPFIGNLFAKVTAAFQGGSKYREEIRKSIDKRPNELVEKVNVFLDALTSAMEVSSAGYKGILVFFDNLEKIPNELKQVDQALINKASLFRQVRCRALYTIPYGLLLKPGQSGLVPNAFALEVIPMVALRNREDSPDILDPNRKKELATIIERRMDVPSIFESIELLDEIIRYSGGCVRDLLSITRLACEYAGDGKVNGEAVRKALNKARGDHLMPVQGIDFPILARVHRDKYIENTEDEFRLLSHRLLVHYNDTVWYDAHPLVQLDSRFIKATKALGGQ